MIQPASPMAGRLSSVSGACWPDRFRQFSSVLLVLLETLQDFSVRPMRVLVHDFRPSDSAREIADVGSHLSLPAILEVLGHDLGSEPDG
jgi:hypothetical protein